MRACSAESYLLSFLYSSAPLCPPWYNPSLKRRGAGVTLAVVSWDAQGEAGGVGLPAHGEVARGAGLSGEVKGAQLEGDGLIVWARAVVIDLRAAIAHLGLAPQRWICPGPHDDARSRAR